MHKKVVYHSTRKQFLVLQIDIIDGHMLHCSIIIQVATGCRARIVLNTYLLKPLLRYGCIPQQGTSGSSLGPASQPQHDQGSSSSGSPSPGPASPATEAASALEAGPAAGSSSSRRGSLAEDVVTLSETHVGVGDGSKGSQRGAAANETAPARGPLKGSATSLRGSEGSPHATLFGDVSNGAIARERMLEALVCPVTQVGLAIWNPGIACKAETAFAWA